MAPSNTIRPALMSHFWKMVADGAITDRDVNAFLHKPKFWMRELGPDPEDAQAFWQGVYDDLRLITGGDLKVPPVPKLTLRQVKSLDKFGLMLMYISPIPEGRNPLFSMSGQRDFESAFIQRIALTGAWVVVEIIQKPDWDEHGCLDDRLMAALKRTYTRDTSHDDLTDGLLAKIAKITGFPKRKTRLPTLEEWGCIRGLFNWLREHRGMSRLPDLGSTHSWEWCQNSYGSKSQIIVGYPDGSGLPLVKEAPRHLNAALFRVLFEP